ncbi:annexin A4-like isoform X1 [Macrobrachium nipponense]|uniref:annexin A4-like isoform X1 n=2 Tax=Macrobrachium nipponense TaxID=159736 RepID=UPI0030C7E3B1
MPLFTCLGSRVGGRSSDSVVSSPHREEINRSLTTATSTWPTHMSYPGGNYGYGQAPYPPAPGGSPYPPAPGGSPYPPAPGGSPYPPAPGGSPYPPAPGGSPYPPAPGGSPYPPAPGGSPYPPAPGGSPYPPAPGGSPYPPAPGGSPYPPAGGSPYPPAPGGSPYPPAPGGSPYPPAPGSSPYPEAGRTSPYPPSTSPYPPASGGSPYPGASPYPPASGSPYPPAGGYPGQPAVQSYAPQTSTMYSNLGSSAPGAGYPGTTAGGYGASPGYPGVGRGTPVGYRPGGMINSYTEMPTVKPQAHFDPSSDAAVLRKAMKGLGTDEAAIINVLSHRTCHERQQILVKYQQAYGREEPEDTKKALSGDLVKDLKSELSGKFEDAVVALMTPLPLFLARELHNAISGIGTNERTLVEILCTRDNASLRMIKDAYYQEYRKKVEDDLHGDTSGDFRRLLISMCACARDEGNCDPALANSLAQQLYKAGEGKLGTDEAEFNRILSSYSYPLLRCVFEEYKKIKGKPFLDAIKSELSGDLQLGMVTLYHTIDNKAAYFAKELRDSMAGMGTNDRALIRLVVSRCEIDMVNIKQEYHKLYNKSLENDIKGDTSGDYKKMLLALIEG